MAQRTKRSTQHVRRIGRRTPAGTSTPRFPNRERCWSNAGADVRLPVCVLHAGLSDWGPNDSYERMQHQGYSLELILKGSGIVEINDTQHLFVPGDMLLTHPDDYCRLYTGPARSWEKTYMAFHPAGASSVIAHLALDDVCHIRLAQTAFQRAKRHFATLIHTIRTRPRGFRERVSSLGYELLLVAAHATHVVEHLEHYPEPLKRAMRHAETHLSTPSNVSGLAEVAGCSRQHLNSMFNAHLGLSAHEWLTRLKISQARNVLETTSDRVAMVARSVGYTDPFHFSRVFKRVTGMSPQQYRHELRHSRTAAIKGTSAGR